MRLIDAEKLRDEVDDTLNWETNNEYNMYSDIMDMIDNASTIEADPVKHGKWKHKVIDGFIPDYDCVCSECGASGVPDYKHCPNCGAKMED